MRAHSAIYFAKVIFQHNDYNLIIREIIFTALYKLKIKKHHEVLVNLYRKL